jgi:predicted 3-demethylubiquinone-9 3-methyltransferase (glyoxalase superfamily)
MTTRTSVRPLLLFEGQAEEAIRFYASLIPGSEIVDIVRCGPGGPGKEGTVMRAEVSLAGQRVLCTDSFIKHAFTFTPAVSLFVECASDEEIVRLADALGEGGATLMPLDNYGFSRRFTWVNDRFGVSWQLNLS